MKTVRWSERDPLPKSLLTNAGTESDGGFAMDCISKVWGPYSGLFPFYRRLVIRKGRLREQAPAPDRKGAANTVLASGAFRVLSF